MTHFYPSQMFGLSFGNGWKGAKPEAHESRHELPLRAVQVEPKQPSSMAKDRLTIIVHTGIGSVDSRFG
jgi:hypothetical protein